MACALALAAVPPLAAARADAIAANSDAPALLADASGVGIPSYSYHALTAAQADDTPQPELAGLTIDGIERGDGIPVLRDGDATAVSVTDLIDALALAAQREGRRLRVETPLGEAMIELGACESRGSVSFCAIDELAARLALGLDFDRGEFVLRVRTAWPRDARVAPRADVPIDIEAPAYSVSYARTQLSYQRSEDFDDFSGTGEFGGGLGDGFWRSSWYQNSSGQRGLYDYAWIAQRENTRWLVGHQVMGLDALLPSFELLGVQAAWTNRPDAVFAGSLDTRRLVAERFLPDRTLRGNGPPGGRAELHVDGEIVDSVTIPLSGRYSFDRVQRAIDPLSIVQVHLYERAFDTVPTRIEDRSFQGSDRLVEDGVLLHFAGLGVEDNPLGDSRVRDDVAGEAAGFWQGRYGVSERVTVEAAVQRSQQGEHAIAGTHIGLGGTGVVSALVGRNGDGAQAARLQTDGQRRHWFWRGFVQEEDAEYRDGVGVQDRSLRYAEGGWMADRWSLSLVARREDGGFSGERADYVKPALSAQPFHNFSFSIRPDSEGDYGYLARWAPHARLYFNAFRDDQRDQFEAHGELTPRSRLIAGWVRDDLAGDRRSLLGYLDGNGARQFRYGAGVLESEGNYGWLLETGAEVGSGLYLSARALDDPLERGAASGPTLWLNLTIDLVNTGAGFVRSSYRADYSQNGSISGRLIVPPGMKQPLDKVPVRVDGDIRAYTDEAGGFHIAGLEPGVHRVELDEENLPLDLTPVKRQVGVEVASGRSTPAPFALELRLGFAGRVLNDEGVALTPTTVQLFDADGRDLGLQTTDGYGYFRFSELRPGRYRVRLIQDGHAAPDREIELVDRFLFEQNLQLR